MRGVRKKKNRIDEGSTREKEGRNERTLKEIKPREKIVFA